MIADELDRIFKELQTDVKEAIEKASKDVAKEGIAQLKGKSPKRTGEYAKGWGQSKRNDTIIIHNKTKPGLTHLLEKGHALRSGGRKLGEVRAQEHIKSVEDWIKDELVKRIENELK